MPDYRFNRFVVEPERRRLLIDGVQAKIGARAFDVLLVLIEKRCRLASKQELLEQVWPNVTVEEGNLQVQIHALRRVLGPDAIATVPGRGYRFVAPMAGSGLGGGDADAPRALGSTGRPPPDLFGRADDIARILDLTGEHQLVSIIGPGGIGKTRAALAALEIWRTGRSPDALVVDLAAVASPSLVAPTIARALGAPTVEAANATRRLADSLSTREMLLVLDNCEHLLGVVRVIAVEIAQNAPQVRLLTTSQAPLKVRGEQIYRLGPLETPVRADLASALDFSAVALFAARAKAADRRFALTPDNVEAVAQICRGLDGVPLAIELAAARVTVLGVSGVRDRLDDRLRLVAGGPLEALPRHRGLAAALEWSYALLDADERRALDRLGVFVGGFSLEAARALLVDEGVDGWTAVDRLASLVDKSLVIVEDGDPPRYRLLESTRAFALAKLEAAGQMALVQARRARALLDVLSSSDFEGAPYARSLRIASDIPNLRAAMDWAIGPDGDRAVAIELAAEFNYAWFALGMSDEAIAYFRVLEPFVDEATAPRLAAKFWLSRAKTFSNAARPAGEEALRAAAIFAELGDPLSEFDALCNAATQFGYAGRRPEAEQALARAETLLDPVWPIWARFFLGLGNANLEFACGSVARARELFQACVDLIDHEPPDAATEEYADLARAPVVGCNAVLGAAEEAIRAAEPILRGPRSQGRAFIVSITVVYRIVALIQLGALEKAAADLRALLPGLKEIPGAERVTLSLAAYLCAQGRRFADAARVLGAFEALNFPGAKRASPPEARARDQAVALTAAALGEAAFTELKTLGRALTPDAAMALAL